MTVRGAPRDPRLYQITILAALLAYGIVALDFDVSLSQVGAIVAACIATQAACTRLWHVPRFDPRSALISALSLCLLLRTHTPAVAVAAGAIAIGSKFLIAIGRKHVFNPTNIALVALIAVTDRAWVSPGQWGNGAFFGFLMACIGGLVVNRAARSDVTYAFMAAYIALVFGRSIAIGEPLAIPLHRLENGAFLLFTFFMVSDPKTTPDSRAGRLLFAAAVAAGAYYVQFRLFRTNGLLWSLACCAPLVPLIDRLFPALPYRWPPAPAVFDGGGHEYEAAVARIGRLPAGRLALR